MAHQTRLYRRQVFRTARERVAWNRVRKYQVRRSLRALEALYRKA